MGKLCCLKGYQNKVWWLRKSSIFRSIKDRLVIFCQIIAGNTLIFLSYLEQEKASQMASLSECIAWMVVGLTESVTIMALNSLTVTAFCRDRNLRKRSTCLVISMMISMTTESSEQGTEKRRKGEKGTGNRDQGTRSGKQRTTQKEKGYREQGTGNSL